MEELETISPEYLKGVKERYLALFSLPDEKIDEVLKLLDYGRILPKIWQEHLEDEYIDKVAKMCNIDRKKSSAILGIIIGILRQLSRKGFVQKRGSDLKRLGFKKSEVKRFRRLAGLLKEQKTEIEIKKVDDWRSLSREVLPRLASLEYSYDLRCKIDGSRVEQSLPMVLMKLTTMVEEEETPKELIFQMDVGTLRHFSRDLSKIYRKARLLRKHSVTPVGRRK